MVDGEAQSGPRRSLAGDAASLAFGALIAQGAVLLTISAVARLVPKSDVGTYQQLSLVYSMTAPLFLGGVPAALLYFLPRAHDERELHDWTVRAYILLGLFGLVSAALIVALREPLASLLGNPDLDEALVLYAPYIAFAFLIAAAPSVLVATGRARAAAGLNAVVGICTLVAVVAAALIEPDARALAAGLSVGGGVAALITVVVVVRSLRLAPRWPSSEATRWLPLLSFGLPIAIGGVAARVGYQFDQVVVSANFPPSEFAVYALGAVELPISLLIQQAVSNVLAPELATRWQAGDVGGMVALFREACRKTTLIVAPMFAFLMVVTPDIIYILYGPRYGESAAIFRIYLLFLPLRIATWGLIPQAVGRTRINLYAAWIILPTNVVVALALVDPLGLKGPAFAAPAATTAATIYYLIRIRGVTERPIRELLPLRAAAACFVVAGAVAAVIVPLQWVDIAKPLRLAISAAVFTPAAIFALRRLRLMNEDDWSRLRGVVRRLWPGRRPTDRSSLAGDGA